MRSVPQRAASMPPVVAPPQRPSSNLGRAAVVVTIISWLGWVLFCPPFGPGGATAAGQNVLVTGASQGIGRALVFEYAKRGAANVVIASRSEAKLQAVAVAVTQKYPSTRVHVVVSDLSNEESSRALIVTSLQLMNDKLDVLILNHITSSRFGTWLSKPDKGFVWEMFNVNTLSYIWTATVAVEEVSKRGGSLRIGVLSSLAGHVGTPKTSVYSATKHALHGFFNAFRAELAYASPEMQRTSVTICAIGATETEGAAQVKDQISSMVQWDSADWAAEAIVRGVAAKKREIFHPHHVVFPSVVLYRLFPALMDQVLVKAHQR